MSSVDELREGERTHMAEGVWYRFSCWKCGEMTEVEFDPRSQAIDCEVCGAEGVIQGEY